VAHCPEFTKPEPDREREGDFDEKLHTPLCKISSTGEIEQRFRLN